MIILITGDYPVYDKFGNKTDKKEFVVSHGIREEYDCIENVVLPQVPPTDLGATFNRKLGEWVIYE